MFGKLSELLSLRKFREDPGYLNDNRILLQGFVEKKGKGLLCKWRKQYLVLLKDGRLMRFYKKPSDLQSPRKVIKVQNAEVSRKGYRFILTAEDFEEEYRAYTILDCDQWVVALQNIVNALWLEEVKESDPAPICHRCGTHRTIPDPMTINDFSPESTLGTGSFGRVLLCRHNSTYELFALKIIKKTAVDNNKVKKCLWVEKRLLRDIRHPFVLELKGWFTTPDSVVLATEYLPGGELFQLVSYHKKFPEDWGRFYAAEVTLALAHLHDLGVIYRDLKLENILISRDGHIKLVDLGVCKTGMLPDDLTDTLCGTYNYSAPEILKGQFYGRAVDWFSLGVMIFEMLVGENPFPGVRTSKKPRVPKTLSAAAQSLLLGLLETDPAQRLGGDRRGALMIMAHPFFRSIHWHHALQKRLQPPFVPQLSADNDTRYFSRTFTSIPCVLPETSGRYIPGFSTWNYDC